MKPTEHPALERTERVWPRLFGDGLDDPGRRQVAAQAVAQDLRDDPRFGLASAEEPDRHAFGVAYVRLRRKIEAGRGDTSAGGREGR